MITNLLEWGQWILLCGVLQPETSSSARRLSPEVNMGGTVRCVIAATDVAAIGLIERSA